MSRPLLFTGLGVIVFALFLWRIFLGPVLWERAPAPLPQIVRGPSNSGPPPKIVTGSGASGIASTEINVVDGDAIRVRGRTIRLVSFDAPESGTFSRCSSERELADRARGSLKGLVAAGDLELRMVTCARRPGTEGMRECNYGRACGVLTALGRTLARNPDPREGWPGHTSAVQPRAHLASRGAKLQPLHAEPCRASKRLVNSTAELITGR